MLKGCHKDVGSWSQICCMARGSIQRLMFSVAKVLQFCTHQHMAALSRICGPSCTMEPCSFLLIYAYCGAGGWRPHQGVRKLDK
jgi:hypothetical protein